MTTDHQCIITTNEDQTRCLGWCIGKHIQTGIVIRLRGDLGAGKTCLVQGIARGLDVPEAYDITSPTYTLINDYPARLPFFHVDLYRINSTLDADGIGLWDLMTSETVVAVEWPDRLPDNEWPAESLEITIGIHSDNERNIEVFGYGLHVNDLISIFVADYETECANILK
jgi:tRNA threonylcarbamoyladenosine biosynthesis protein TsaE